MIIFNYNKSIKHEQTKLYFIICHSDVDIKLRFGVRHGGNFQKLHLHEKYRLLTLNYSSISQLCSHRSRRSRQYHPI